MKDLILTRTRISVLSLVIALALLSSCKKSPKQKQPAEPGTTTASRADLTRDSIFLYAKEVYLWYDALPSYDAFKPRSYTSASTDPINFNNELYALSQYKTNPTTGQPFEFTGTAGKAKYSYIFDRTTKNPVAGIVTPDESSVDLEGNGNDLGFALTGLYNTAQNTSYDLYIRFVAEGSPAFKAGLRRGSLISKINGQSYGANFSSEVSALNNAIALSSLTITKKNSDASETTVTLNKAVYKSSPVYSSRVIDTLGKKIGYLAYARFSNEENSQPLLLSIFNSFATAGVTDLVIDLRYNGGGYVSTSQYLTNLIAPSSLNGKVMFVEYYNALMQANSAKILANQPLLDDKDKVQYRNGKILTYADIDYSPTKYTFKFEKKGNLETVTNVVFITTSATASASELLINNLKPHMNIKTVGAKSYGKPVGFFPVTIDKYDVYFSMFQTKNSANEGDYFAGFTPDKTTNDDVRFDFGSSKENSIATAIAYITKGTFIIGSTAKNTTISGAVDGSSIKTADVPSRQFNGAIETRHILKSN